MKQIPGFPTYFADKSGKVYRVQNGVKKLLKPNNTKEGYQKYDLYKTVNGKLIRKTMRSQIIMKKTFNLKGAVVDHISGNRHDNSLKNLSAKSYSSNNKNKHGHLYPHSRDLYK